MRPGAPFLAIVGPTGAGKTALSLATARSLGGEIVSMDSRQVYRGMDVGTAKASLRERALAPHHGLDIRNPDQRYSAGEFARDARRWMTHIRGRGRVPILVGGTGFFLRALTDPLFREPPVDADRRADLDTRLASLGESELARWVRAIDPDRAALAVAGGRQRMVRTLSVALLTGRPLSWWHRHRAADSEPVRGVVCVLTAERDWLNLRIDRRVEEMVAAGFVAEVEDLLRAGYDRDDPGLSGVGYREMVDVVAGERTLEDAMARTRTATRQYARRQGTWFRRQVTTPTTRVDAREPVDHQLETVLGAWRRAA